MGELGHFPVSTDVERSWGRIQVRLNALNFHPLQFRNDLRRNSCSRSTSRPFVQISFPIKLHRFNLGGIHLNGFASHQLVRLSPAFGTDAPIENRSRSSIRDLHVNPADIEIVLFGSSSGRVIHGSRPRSFRNEHGNVCAWHVAHRTPRSPGFRRCE